MSIVTSTPVPGGGRELKHLINVQYSVPYGVLYSGDPVPGRGRHLQHLYNVLCSVGTVWCTVYCIVY